MSDSIVILNFHGVGAAPRQLDAGEQRVWLETGPFLEILDAAKGRSDVEITFDDGNLSDVEIALPALFERGLRATFFVIADRIDREHYLKASDVRALSEAGMRIGSHGMRHVPWHRLNAQSLHEELVTAKNQIERALGDGITEAACPFGAYDRRSLAGLRHAGFSRVYTSDTGPTTPGSWLAVHNTLHAGDTAETARIIMDSRSGNPVRVMKMFVKRCR